MRPVSLSTYKKQIAASTRSKGAKFEIPKLKALHLKTHKVTQSCYQIKVICEVEVRPRKLQSTTPAHWLRRLGWW